MPSGAKHWFYTLNNPTDEERAELSVAKFQERKVLYSVYQYETGESGTPHFQGYMYFEVRRSPAYMKKWFPRAHWLIARGTPEECKKYCTKEEGRLEGPYEYGNLPKGKGSRTDLEAFRSEISENPVDANELCDRYGDVYAKYPRFCRELNEYHTRRRYLQTLAAFVPRVGWQTELVATLRGPIDSRKVVWIWEATGGVGKSFFCRNFRDGVGRLGYYVTGGKHADIQYGYSGESVVYFDWARDHEENFPYALVEQFKNGYYFSPKYESRSRLFEPPHVVCFANFPPNTGKLSQDRWDIRPIDE